MSSLFSQTRFTSIHFFKARIFNQLSQLHYDTEILRALLLRLLDFVMNIKL